MTSVSLIEQHGAGPTPGQPQVTTMGSMQGQESQATIDFQPGGGTGKPVLRVGSTTLGYEDLLIIVGMVNLVATTVKVYAEVRS